MKAFRSTPAAQVASASRARPQLNRRFLLLVSLLFALFVVVTAINAPPQVGMVSFRTFWGPFQRISDDNRWICSGLALVLIALCSGRRFASTVQGGNGIVICLVALHLLILVKNLFSVGASAFLFFIGIVLLLWATASVARGMRGLCGGSLPACWKPLVVASVVFLAANLLQYRLDPAATRQVSDRFHGLTSNPQMYALTTAIMVPALLFQYMQDHRWGVRLGILLTFLVLFYFALCSGSRLSLLLSGFSVLMFFRQKVTKVAALAIPLALIVLVWSMWSDHSLVDPNSHLASTENTRSAVWKVQISELVNHPVFGEPLESGERAGFGENSFLAAGAALGGLGLLLALGLAWVMGRQILRLVQLERRVGWRPELALPIAVLSACLLGGVFEAFMLGIFTLPLTAMLYTTFISEEILRGGQRRPAGAGLARLPLQKMARRLNVAAASPVPTFSTGRERLKND